MGTDAVSGWGGKGGGEKEFEGLQSLRLVWEEREKSSRSFLLPPRVTRTEIWIIKKE